ncbi:MAG: flagellar biosynthesis protein FlhB [Fibrobacteres bacterium]|nr:flagellar biosynthesis protein FlhB [Fibrobacterota bacterium]
MADDEGKTEDPTPKRISDARNKGQVAKSQELNAVAVLFMGFWSIYIYRTELYEGLTTMMRLVFQESTRTNVSVENFHHYCIVGGIWMIKLLGPIMAILLVTGIVVNFLQVGWLFTTKPLVPDFTKLNPLSGIKNLFSMDKIVKLIKEVIKLTLITAVAAYTLKDQLTIYYSMTDQTAEAILIFIFSTIFDLGMRIAIALLFLAVADFIYEKYRYNKNMKMSKTEVKDERKQSEGDPEVKGKIKSLQREMAQRRMMSEVPKATVVVTNPTFIAIALRYELGVDKAPVVLAKGKRKTAETIREIAKANDIPIVEDKPLARGMYDLIEIGEEIPKEYFSAVAEILAYVYKLKGKAA